MSQLYQYIWSPHTNYLLKLKFNTPNCLTNGNGKYRVVTRIIMLKLEWTHVWSTEYFISNIWRGEAHKINFETRRNQTYYFPHYHLVNEVHKFK